MRILGLMSGTSMDGLDCCIADLSITDTSDIKFHILDYKTYTYTKATKQKIHDTVFLKKYSIEYIDNYLGDIFLKIVHKFLNNRSVDLIASHGQTISHLDKEYSIQVGNPQAISQNTNIPVISNFRKEDIKNKGNGAPLVPLLDWYLFKNYSEDIISLNIGGISNLSLVCGPNKNKILGFDIGPGMCLIDRYVQEYWGELFDKDGTLSSKGLINQSLLNELLKDKYINKTPPKSLTTENYGIEYLDKLKEAYPLINKYDFLRTLVNFTVRSIKKNINTFINVQYLKNVNMIISGGGAKNKVLYNDIKICFSNFKISLLSYNGLNTDNKEAFLMCLMGYTRYKNIPNNIPSVTGATKEVLCGEIYE